MAEKKVISDFEAQIRQLIADHRRLTALCKETAAERYENFLRTRAGGKILFLELGVGYNTPVIIKYPFWQMTAKNPNATYACINQGQAVCPPEIEQRSICMNADIGQILQNLSDAAIQ